MSITRAQIELSSKCNFKCITCRHGYYQYGQNLSASVCDMLCNEVFPTLKTLELQGTGESLLNPQFSAVIEKAALNVDEITLITNASLLSEKHLRQFIKANVQLVVSLDGADQKTFSIHRPVGDFNDIINNLSGISELRDGYRGTMFSFTVNMVLTRKNYNTISEMIDLLSRIGADYLFVSEVRECMPDKNAWEALNILDLTLQDEFKMMLENCASHAAEKRLGFSFNPYKKPEGIKKSVCEAPWKHIFVSANGDVSVCCELSHVFGNLNNSSLSEILSCDDLIAFRNNMLLGEYDNHCINCCLPWGLPY